MSFKARVEWPQCVDGGKVPGCVNPAGRRNVLVHPENTTGEIWKGVKAGKVEKNVLQRSCRRQALDIIGGSVYLTTNREKQCDSDTRRSAKNSPSNSTTKNEVKTTKSS